MSQARIVTKGRPGRNPRDARIAVILGEPTDIAPPTTVTNFGNKLLRAGDSQRRTRFHTALGQFVPPARCWHFTFACLSWVRLHVGAGVSIRPWLSYSAVRRISRILPVDAAVLEIGAGMSTLWLAPRCARLISIEADQDWFERLRVLLVASDHHHVDLRYLWHASDMTDYSTIPDASLDFILVDGGPRAEALHHALPKLKPGGFLYVDNTDVSTTSGSCREDLLAHASRIGGSIELYPDFSPCSPHATEGILWLSPHS